VPDDAGAKKRRERTLKDEMLEMLRLKNAELRKRNSSLERALREAENDRLKRVAVATKAEEDREALYNAVRVLSGVVPMDLELYNVSQGRKARHEARKLLEQRKIPAPHTLGSARKASPRKKKRRRRT
jgi:translation elongation factor EF-G